MVGHPLTILFQGLYVIFSIFLMENDFVEKSSSFFIKKKKEKIQAESVYLISLNLKITQIGIFYITCIFCDL